MNDFFNRCKKRLEEEKDRLQHGPPYPSGIEIISSTTLRLTKKTLAKNLYVYTIEFRGVIVPIDGDKTALLWLRAEEYITEMKESHKARVLKDL